jgi:tetratricopeptide (TPR) repeat protein
MNIFLSYGHDEYDKFAHRLKRDLELHGFKVWMDVDGIRGTADWEKAIENGINGSDWFVIMMTQHSCRRPDGVCLDEVSYARFLGKSIAPIMIENVKPPLCIARIQYIDMENYFKPGEVSFDEESYQEKFNTLINILHGVEEISREGEYEVLHSRLIPLDNDVYYEHFRHNFYGREKLFSYYRDWVNSPSNLLWIVGNAGVGKTAFIAKLTENNEAIKAVHFCRYNDSDRADPKRAIMSIAYYLSTQLDDYKNILLGLHDLDRLQEKSTERLFAYLLAEPLNKIEKATDTTVIVIDALDEATCEGRNELADIISSRHDVLPNWVKIIITSRDEPSLRRRLSRVRPITFEDERFTDNRGDIQGYFEMRLENIPIKNKHHVIQVLLDKSDGNFLYAKTITDDILTGVLSVDEYEQFPNGLTGIYSSYFDRLFKTGKCDYRHDIRPVMEILCAEYSPIRSDDILNILDLDEYDFDDIKEEIAQMFLEKEDTIEPIHKSIVDWLVDRERAGTYRVSLNKGHKKLAEYCKGMISKGTITEYVLKYAARHLINAEMYDGAIELLNNQKFQDRRISVLGLDTAFREYLYEISTLVDLGIDVGEEIYKRSTFMHYFSVYRKFLYNTGLYFTLRDNKFDNTLRDEDSNMNFDGRVGIVNYLYITERFDRAIKAIEKLLQNEAALDPKVVVELHNVYALCYRKYVAFDLAKDHFERALNYDKAVEDEYDKSISAVNLGKIAYHELDWDQASKWNERALSLLEMAYKKTDNEDLQINIELFIAEYHRLIAECLIWNMDVSKAEKHLEETEKIYRKIASRDRYYVRFIYTSALVKIFGGDTGKGISLCDDALEIATSLYDQSQIMFYKALALLKIGENSEAYECAASGMDKAEQIGAWLEMEEIALVKSLAEKESVINHTEHYFSNEYIQKWSLYALETIEKVIK